MIQYIEKRAILQSKLVVYLPITNCNAFLKRILKSLKYYYINWKIAPFLASGYYKFPKWNNLLLKKKNVNKYAKHKYIYIYKVLRQFIFEIMQEHINFFYIWL